LKGVRGCGGYPSSADRQSAGMRKHEAELPQVPLDRGEVVSVAGDEGAIVLPGSAGEQEVTMERGAHRREVDLALAA
jgi:hypothetical protein